MGFIPGKNKLTVRQGEAQEKIGDLYIPETSKEKPAEGKVVHTNSNDYTVGETILFGKYAGTVIIVDNEELILLDEDEILGKRV